MYVDIKMLSHCLYDVDLVWRTVCVFEHQAFTPLAMLS